MKLFGLNNILNREIKSKYVLHPFFISTYFILNIYNINIHELSTKVVWIPLVVTLLATFFLWFFLRVTLKDGEKSGLITSVLVVSFFTFGYIHETIIFYFTTIPKFLQLEYLIIPFSILTAGEIWLFLKIHKEKKITVLLNLVLSLPFIFSIAQIVIVEMNKNSIPKETQKIYTKVRGDIPISKDLPDIYYIVPDGYTRSDILKIYFDFDNTPFTESLSERGFYVAQDSITNYRRTIISLASSLNMKYINYLTDILGKNSRNLDPLLDLINNSFVVSFLKDKGYKFVNYCSGGEPTVKLRNADLNVLSLKRRNPLVGLIKKSSMLKIFFNEINHVKRQLIPETFKALKEDVEKNRPKFVLVHILAPHPPFLFGPNVENIRNPRINLMDWREPQMYVSEMIYLNKELIKLVDSIKSKSEIPPIIIIQGDHGAYIHVLRKGKLTYAFKKEENVFMRSSILNAYLLPEKCKHELYPSISPVNTFRVVLNCLFNTSYELLPDKTYECPHRKPYNLTDFTEMVSTMKEKKRGQIQ